MTEPVYLDCNATTPLDPAVGEAMARWFGDEIGNAGSRTHGYGLRARRAVERAREQVGAVVDASSDEVLFTSGATESNNIAILGLARFGEESGRRHIVTTSIEHKAILEPVEALAARGFEVSLVETDATGVVAPDAVRRALRPDTLLVSVMQVNNETGVRQPVLPVARELKGHEAYFHVDAAQGFGKELSSLRSQRIDLISVSSHKVYGPVGVGALIVRNRGFDRLPLAPLTYGGGQERGLRPGTLPTALIVGFGTAATVAGRDAVRRAEHCAAMRKRALEALGNLGIRLHGDSEHCLPHVLNFSIEGVDSEALMVAVKDLVAISNGSACTSQNYTPSHVLEAMGLPREAVDGAVRMSWCHMTPEVDWVTIAAPDQSSTLKTVDKWVALYLRSRRGSRHPVQRIKHANADKQRVRKLEHVLGRGSLGDANEE